MTQLKSMLYNSNIMKKNYNLTFSEYIRRYFPQKANGRVEAVREGVAGRSDNMLVVLLLHTTLEVVQGAPLMHQMAIRDEIS